MHKINWHNLPFFRPLTRSPAPSSTGLIKNSMSRREQMILMTNHLSTYFPRFFAFIITFNCVCFRWDKTFPLLQCIMYYHSYCQLPLVYSLKHVATTEYWINTFSSDFSVVVFNRSCGNQLKMSWWNNCLSNRLPQITTTLYSAIATRFTVKYHKWFYSVTLQSYWSCWSYCSYGFDFDFTFWFRFISFYLIFFCERGSKWMLFPLFTFRRLLERNIRHTSNLSRFQNVNLCNCAQTMLYNAFAYDMVANANHISILLHLIHTSCLIPNAKQIKQFVRILDSIQSSMKNFFIDKINKMKIWNWLWIQFSVKEINDNT